MLTSERLSLTACSPAAASRRACETELAGIHNAGRSPSSPGQLPMKPLTTWSESAGLTSMATQRSPTGSAVSLNFLPSVEIWSAMDGSATTGDGYLAFNATRGRDAGPVGQGIAEEAPQDDAGHGNDDGDERSDDADADASPSRCDFAVAAGPFAAFPLAGVMRAGRGPRLWRGSGVGRGFGGGPAKLVIREFGFARARLQILRHPGVLRLGMVRLVLVVVIGVVLRLVLGLELRLLYSSIFGFLILGLGVPRDLRLLLKRLGRIAGALGGTG